MKANKYSWFFNFFSIHIYIYLILNNIKVNYIQLFNFNLCKIKRCSSVKLLKEFIRSMAFNKCVVRLCLQVPTKNLIAMTSSFDSFSTADGDASCRSPVSATLNISINLMWDGDCRQGGSSRSSSKSIRVISLL